MKDTGGEHTRLACWLESPALLHPRYGARRNMIMKSQRSPLRDRFIPDKSAQRSAFDNNCVTMRSVFLVVAMVFVVAGSVAAKEDTSAAGAEENVRAVQSKLADEGCYFGEIDGAYSSDFSAALSRYQIRNGLPITGQLDAETSKALGAKPAVGPSIATTEQSPETWRQLRKRERRKSTKARQLEPAATESPSPADNETPPTATEPPIQTTPVEARTSTETTQPASAPPATASADEFSAERCVIMWPRLCWQDWIRTSAPKPSFLPITSITTTKG